MTTFDVYGLSDAELAQLIRHESNLTLDQVLALSQEARRRQKLIATGHKCFACGHVHDVPKSHFTTAQNTLEADQGGR